MDWGCALHARTGKFGGSCVTLADATLHTDDQHETP